MSGSLVPMKVTRKVQEAGSVGFYGKTSMPSALATMSADPSSADHLDESSSSEEAPSTTKTVMGDVTVVQEDRILDRTGQDVGDPQTELEALSPDLLEVDYTNTRLRTLPPLAHLHQVEVRRNKCLCSSNSSF